MWKMTRGTKLFWLLEVSSTLVFVTLMGMAVLASIQIWRISEAKSAPPPTPAKPSLTEPQWGMVRACQVEGGIPLVTPDGEGVCLRSSSVIWVWDARNFKRTESP